MKGYRPQHMEGSGGGGGGGAKGRQKGVYGYTDHSSGTPYIHVHVKHTR